MEKDKYSFLDTLDEEQANNANLIIDGAIKRGLNPRLAVALAYQESGLRHADKDKVKIGADGEIGLMQIKIPTGKMQGYKPEQLNTLQGNVDAGLDYLKSGFDRYNDPVLAAAGYNAGYDHPYFSNPEKHDLPKSTWSYLESIKGYGGFEEPEKKASDANQADQTKNITPASENDFRTAKAAAMGALGGATLGGVADKLFGGRTPAPTPGVPNMAPGAPPSGGLPARVEPTMSGPSAQATRILQGGQGDTLGTTGRARQEGYNIETAQRAANKGEASKLSPQARQVLASAPGLTSTESGVLYPRTEARPTAGPRGAPPSQVNLDIGKIVPGEPTMGAPRPISPPSALPGPSAGQQFMQGAKGVVGALGRSPMIAGALSGAGALGGAQEAQTRYSQGDTLGAAVAGIGALGGLAAAVPHPMTRIIGGGLAMASPAALMLIDQMRQRSAANQQPQP
jgi:hypothetical protein